MLDDIIQNLPEGLKRLNSTQLSHIVVASMRELNPNILLLFEKTYALRLNHANVGLDLKVGREQELLYLQELLVPVREFLEVPQMKGIILPKLLGTFQEALDAFKSDFSLLESFGDLIPQKEAMFSYLKHLPKVLLSQKNSPDPQLVESWNQLEPYLIAAIDSPMFDNLKDFRVMESPQIPSELAERVLALLLIPIYEYEYFLFLKQKIQALEKEEKTGIEVAKTKVQEDVIELPQDIGPNIKSSLIDGVAKVLIPYFTEETDEINLKALLKREGIKKRLFFNGPGNRFVEVFRQLHERGDIYSNKKATCDWICQHFCFSNNKTKKVTNFKEKTVYDILSSAINPVRKASRIDLSSILDIDEEKK